jgi:hypothetical protein
MSGKIQNFLLLQSDTWYLPLRFKWLIKGKSKIPSEPKNKIQNLFGKWAVKPDTF